MDILKKSKWDGNSDIAYRKASAGCDQLRIKCSIYFINNISANTQHNFAKDV